MKKKPTFGFTVLLVFTLSSFSYGQVWKNLEKKVGKKIEQQADRRLERKIDKTIDKGFDKVEEAVESKPSNESKKSKNASKSNSDESKISEMLSGVLSGQNSGPIAAQYSFKSGIKYEITSNDKKQSVTTTTMWISDQSQIGMSTDMQKSMFMVMDGERMITFMDEQKAYMVMDLKNIQKTIIDSAPDDEGPSNYKMEKIGTEKILGYKCEIYKITDEDSESIISITPDIHITGFMKTFASMSRNSKLPTMDVIPGMLMRMESKDLKKKGDGMKMIATEIIKTPKTIKSSEYKSFGSF